MTHWIKDAISAALVVRQIRKRGNTEKLALVEEQELIESRHWLAQRDYENQLMQRVIIGTTKYESICESCEEKNECQREQKGKRGCDDWWLRFLNDAELDACKARAMGQTNTTEHEGEKEHGESLPV